MANFEKMTVAELKEYASNHSIDISGSKNKSSILSVILDSKANISLAEESGSEKIIGSNKIMTTKRVPVSNTRPNEENIMTVGSADNFKDKKFSKIESVESSDKIAIYSEKNMNWTAVGRVSKGYNIVTEEAAKMWLTRKGIRKATPEEVASHYGL